MGGDAPLRQAGPDHLADYPMSAPARRPRNVLRTATSVYGAEYEIRAAVSVSAQTLYAPADEDL